MPIFKAFHGSFDPFKLLDLSSTTFPFLSFFFLIVSSTGGLERGSNSSLIVLPCKWNTLHHQKK